MLKGNTVRLDLLFELSIALAPVAVISRATIDDMLGGVGHRCETHVRNQEQTQCSTS